MDIKEFYSEFNKITSEHKTSDETTTKLNSLMESIKDTEVADAIDLDIDVIVADLESQKETADSVKKVDLDEEQDSSYYDDDEYYDDSYQSSY